MSPLAVVFYGWKVVLICGTETRRPARALALVKPRVTTLFVADGSVIRSMRLLALRLNSKIHVP